MQVLTLVQGYFGKLSTHRYDSFLTIVSLLLSHNVDSHFFGTFSNASTRSSYVAT